MDSSKRVTDLEAEILELEKHLFNKKIELQQEKNKVQESNINKVYSKYFTNEDVEKYCRQIIVNNFGPKNQLKIKNTKFLVIGAGGLGCPAALYLAAAGVGSLGIIDSDVVSISNLHRQVLYGEADLNQIKSEVACRKLSLMHSNVRCIPIKEKLTRENCESIFKEFDIILDCTDNVATRYLVNDICVLLKKPAILGNCIKIEGQLLVCLPGVTPCYRCLFTSPASEACTGSCSEDGVLGPVPGVIGVLQALEAIKVASGSFDLDSYKKMILFDGEQLKFRNINVRYINKECLVCNNSDPITLNNLPDYESIYGGSIEDKGTYPPEAIIPKEQRIEVKEFSKVLEKDTDALILDVRPDLEFEMCHLPRSINLPFRNVFSSEKNLSAILENRKSDSVYVLCRRGNDSQRAVSFLNKQQNFSDFKFIDVIGGLYAWNENIDPNFPIY